MAEKTEKGFTLIELMIVVAIIGVLASIALPAYQSYTKRAKFSEVIVVVNSYKLAFEVQVQKGRITAITQADAGAFGIPPAAGASGFIQSVTMTDGVITATGTAEVDNHDYVLTPSGVGVPIIWVESGSCVSAGLC